MSNLAENNVSLSARRRLRAEQPSSEQRVELTSDHLHWPAAAIFLSRCTCALSWSKRRRLAANI
jgi:hypothetical protein